MTKRKLLALTLLAAFTPALAISLPTSSALAQPAKMQRPQPKVNTLECQLDKTGTHCINAGKQKATPKKIKKPAVIKKTEPKKKGIVKSKKKPAPKPVAKAPKPWTKAWYAYCSQKYRSFNPKTGFYKTYSGKKRLCQ